MEQKTENTAINKENGKHKNSMFVDLFYEDETARENDISLYNALHEDQPLPEDAQIQRIRVDDVLYMNFKNDVSFGIEDKVLVFTEHQATINENMPLRSLMYIGRAYEQLVPVKSRYKKKMVKLPAPEFYTFYNGVQPLEQEMELKLSDAYQSNAESPMLELKVKVLNINPGENHRILDKCKVLKEYGIFNDTVRKYTNQGKEEPVKLAIKECIEHGILADYLKRKGSQVVNMLIAEYDYGLDIEVQREEARAEGFSQGITRGELIKLIKMIQKKCKNGKSLSQTASDLEEKTEDIATLYELANENRDTPAEELLSLYLKQ